jgi:osmoprotectant transport system permease protein
VDEEGGDVRTAFLLGDVRDWLTDPENWSGSDGVPSRLLEHTLLTVVALFLAMLVGLPLAIWLGHLRRFGTLAVNVSNVGRAVPIVALLSLLALGFVGSGDFGAFGRAGLATLITLALFALPPIITNAYVAVSGVDDDLVEAARGMGMDEWQVLRRVELPVAMPLIVSGVRLAVVQVWATATIAALVAGPGLGRIIIHGYDSNRPAEVIAGSLIVALIALALEGLMAFLQRTLDPLPAGSR